MKKHTLWIVAAALVLVTGITAGAQEMRRHRGSFLIHHIIRELDLSDAQVAQIKQILVEERPALQNLADKHKQQRQQLRAIGGFDEAKVREIAQSDTQTYVDFVVEREKLRSRIYAVLTPAQQEKVNKFLDHAHEHMQDHLAHLGDQL